MPRIKGIIKSFFNRKELNCYINPEEVYAFGYALEETVKKKGNNNKKTIEIKYNEISDEEIEEIEEGEKNDENENKKIHLKYGKGKKLKEDMKKNDIPKEILSKSKKKMK